MYVQAHLADCYFEIGNYQQCRNLHEEALKWAQALNDRVAETVSLDTIGLTYQLQNSPPQAQEYFESSLALQEKINYPRGKAFVLNHLGLLLANQEEVEQAGIFLYESLMLRSESADKPASIDTEATLAWLDMARGDNEFALMRAREVVGWLAENGTTGVELPMQVYWQCFTIFNLAQEKEEALSVLESAFTHLKTQANQIADEAIRHDFLHNVPYNLRIWQAWQNINQ